MRNRPSIEQLQPGNAPGFSDCLRAASTKCWTLSQGRKAGEMSKSGGWFIGWSEEQWGEECVSDGTIVELEVG